MPEHMQRRCDEVSAALVRQASRPRSRKSRPLSYYGCMATAISATSSGNSAGRCLVDLDDCVNGPRMQDLWMFLSGNADEQQGQWAEIMRGYDQFGAIELREVRFGRAAACQSNAQPRGLDSRTLGGSGISARLSLGGGSALLGGLRG